MQRKNILSYIQGNKPDKGFYAWFYYFFFTKGRQLANVYLWKEEAVMNKDSAFPSRWWVSRGIAAGCHDVLCCHKDFTHRLDNLFNKSTCIYHIFFFPGICLETHSHIIMHAQCLLTWHTLFIISNAMLSLGGESSLCNIAHTVPCDDPCPCWEKNKKKPKKTQKSINTKVHTYPSNQEQVRLATGYVFLTSQKHLLVSEGNVLA